MAENSTSHDCGATVTRVIREPRPASGPITVEEIMAVLMQRARISTAELVGTFKARLRYPEDKKAFAEILKRISKIQTTTSGINYIILRKSSPSTFGEGDGEVIDAPAKANGN